MSTSKPKANQETPHSLKDSLQRNSFLFTYIIGRGGFGKVWKVEHRKTKAVFALKEMTKLKIIDKKSEKSITEETKFLAALRHPFLVNMHYAFQDNDNLYLVLDFLSGGDLRYHVSRYRRFSEEQTRFFIASIIVSLDYIHKNNVIHRDIKPENMVLDDKGYLRITDFGIAKENSEDTSGETSGTPGYMAPEVMIGSNHSFSVDFFAVGIIGYEFMFGKRPYYGSNKKEIKEQMLSTQVVISPKQKQFGWSPESADFINLLLQRKPERRLGAEHGAKDLMEHPWLKYYPWKQLAEKTLLSPFIPETKDNFDRNYCESVERITDNTKVLYAELVRRNKLNSKSFADYYYNIEGKEVNEKPSNIPCDILSNLAQENDKKPINFLKPNLLHAYLPILINKEAIPKASFLNKNSTRNIPNFLENRSNISHQLPGPDSSRLNMTNQALSCRIPSNCNKTYDVINDSIAKKEENLIHRMSREDLIINSQKPHDNNDNRQYNSMIINKILNHKARDNQFFELKNKQLLYKCQSSNCKLSLLKSQSRSSSLLNHQSNGSFKSLYLEASSRMNPVKEEKSRGMDHNVYGAYRLKGLSKVSIRSLSNQFNLKRSSASISPSMCFKHR